MITLKSCVSHNTMVISEKDHAPLKSLYTTAAENYHKKITYKRYGEVIVATIEDVFSALTSLDRSMAGTK